MVVEKAPEKVADAEMKDVSGGDTGETTKEAAEPVKDPDLLTYEDVKEQLRYIEKTVSSKEPRFMTRAVRAVAQIRKKTNSRVLRKLLLNVYASQPTNLEKEEYLAYLDSGEMETEEATNNAGGVGVKKPVKKAANLVPEVEVYVQLLVLIHLMDKERHDDAIKCADRLMQKIVDLNRRTLDILAAKCYFYYARAYEVTNRLEQIRGFLHARLRTSTLRHDDDGTAVLTNLLLRNYTRYSLFDQADKLVKKSAFPTTANNNEMARFLYYTGRIKALQLEYSESYKSLVQSLRKAPQVSGLGFRQCVQKLAIVVELLLGDIPDRSTFRQAQLRKSLEPYFQLTQAVRAGSLKQFNQVLEKHASRFQREGNYLLITRLRHNVIKTGVRKINFSYSRISLADVATKLSLDSAEDAEFIVAKAIRDGVIEATIDHERRFVQSKETDDLYSTREPMSAYHQRIKFCMDIHDQSVKAMRFPPKSYHTDLESAEERREREVQDLEYAKEMADQEDDEF